MYEISSQYLKERLRKVRKAEWSDGQTDRRTDKGRADRKAEEHTD